MTTFTYRQMVSLAFDEGGRDVWGRPARLVGDDLVEMPDSRIPLSPFRSSPSGRAAGYVAAIYEMEWRARACGYQVEVSSFTDLNGEFMVLWLRITRTEQAPAPAPAPQPVQVSAEALKRVLLSADPVAELRASGELEASYAGEVELPMDRQYTGRGRPGR